MLQGYRKVRRGGIDLWVPESEPQGAMNRRQFVTTAGGIVVGAGLAACGGRRDGTEPTPLGAVRVIIVGLDPSATNGGTVLVEPLEGQDFDAFTVELPAGGDSGVVTDIPIGTYRGTYTPPANHALDAGETNPRNVEILEDLTTEVSWTVVVVDSTLRITVTGLDASATTGGTASVLRTDIGGQTAINVGIPASGTVDTGVNPGTYEVTYTPPSSHTVNQGVSNPATVNALSGQIAAVSFAVTFQSGGGGTAPDIYAHSFEDGTAGSFVTGNLTPLPLGGGAPWSLDSIGAPSPGGATQSIKQTYPVSTNNVGSPFYYQLPSTRTSLYVRFAMMHSTNFNSNNEDEQKVCRLEGPTFFQQGTLIVVGRKNAPSLAGLFAWKWDGLDTSPFVGNIGVTQNPPAPNMNDLQNQWVWIEIFADITTDNALRVMIWVNDSLHLDVTTAKGNQGRVYGIVQFDGTINSMATQSTMWIDEIGISSQRMGIP
jgi:hypothetical protein